METGEVVALVPSGQLGSIPRRSTMATYPNFRQRGSAQNGDVVGSNPTVATPPYPNWQRSPSQNREVSVRIRGAVLLGGVEASPVEDLLRGEDGPVHDVAFFLAHSSDDLSIPIDNPSSVDAVDDRQMASAMQSLS